ncbi:MAG TPA: hypothetical protein VM260_17920, partial [Pirellula sp.]|nr:hypothetical protein [Pirellula sp.]
APRPPEFSLHSISEFSTVLREATATTQPIIPNQQHHKKYFKNLVGEFGLAGTVSTAIPANLGTGGMVTTTDPAMIAFRRRRLHLLAAMVIFRRNYPNLRFRKI